MIRLREILIVLFDGAHHYRKANWIRPRLVGSDYR